MTRRFQFSLRALLVAMTVACLLMGWVVDRARRRGAAIDALEAGANIVVYANGRSSFDINPVTFEELGHFWLDLKREPVEVWFNRKVKLDAAVGETLRRAIPVKSVELWNVYDDDLKHLYGLNNDIQVVFFGDDCPSDKAIAELQQRLPGITIENLTPTERKVDESLTSGP